MTLELGFLLLRVIVGLGIAAHGAQKLFGWFGGYGIKGTGGVFESLGFRPGSVFAMAAGVSEFFGGLMIVLGLLGPVGPALVTATMITAIFTVHIKNGFFAPTGYELNLMYIAGSLAAAFAPLGAFSLDSVLGLTVLHGGAITWAVLAIGALGGFTNLALRRPQPQPTTASSA